MDGNSLEVSEAAARITQAFFNDVWRAEFLNDRDSDYVELAVPYAEKDEAYRLGAAWNGRVWRVNRRDDMTAFQHWMPEVEATPAPGGS